MSGEILLTCGVVMIVHLKQQPTLIRLALLLIAPLWLSFAVVQPVHAAPRATFEFTCETTEDDFYDWIEAELWPKSTPGSTAAPFGRNLDAAFDILTDENTRRANWEITLTSADCQMNVGTELRRESLFETIEDAHADGHGLVLRRR